MVIAIGLLLNCHLNKEETGGRLKKERARRLAFPFIVASVLVQSAFANNTIADQVNASYQFNANIGVQSITAPSKTHGVFNCVTEISGHESYSWATDAGSEYQFDTDSAPEGLYTFTLTSNSPGACDETF